MTHPVYRLTSTGMPSGGLASLGSPRRHIAEEGDNPIGEEELRRMLERGGTARDTSNISTDRFSVPHPHPPPSSTSAASVICLDTTAGRARLQSSSSTPSFSLSSVPTERDDHLSHASFDGSHRLRSDLSAPLLPSSSARPRLPLMDARMVARSERAREKVAAAERQKVEQSFTRARHSLSNSMAEMKERPGGSHLSSHTAGTAINWSNGSSVAASAPSPAGEWRIQLAGKEKALLADVEKATRKEEEEEEEEAESEDEEAEEGDLRSSSGSS